MGASLSTAGNRWGKRRAASAMPARRLASMGDHNLSCDHDMSSGRIASGWRNRRAVFDAGRIGAHRAIVRKAKEDAVDKEPNAFRTIGEAAEELNLPQHVLRFWETRFSQIRPMKRSGGRALLSARGRRIVGGDSPPAVWRRLYDKGRTAHSQATGKQGCRRSGAAIATGICGRRCGGCGSGFGGKRSRVRGSSGRARRPSARSRRSGSSPAGRVADIGERRSFGAFAARRAGADAGLRSSRT